jgi:hypothetical protein
MTSKRGVIEDEGEGGLTAGNLCCAHPCFADA